MLVTGAPSRRKIKQPSKEDLELWHYLTRDIKPLKAKQLQRKAASLDAAGEKTASAPLPASRAVALSSASPAGALPASLRRRGALPELRPGDLHAMDRRRARRLRRGRLPIEARLDLHGLNQADAHHALQRFVQQSVTQGRRCILVITGKGGHQGKASVLRRQVPLWLNQADLRDKVVGFEHAQPEHGGSGALYLLLKRRRSRPV